MPDTPWLDLRLPPATLLSARLQCHHAIQINTRLARSFVAAQADDSHTSLTWDAQTQALMGQPFSAEGRELQAGLRLRDLTLLFDRLEYRLHGESFNDALDWLGERLRTRGLDPAALALPIHFELADHPLLHGAKFDAASYERELEELARYYSNAAARIGEVYSTVRCWPHHFDIAALIVKGGQSLGIGMSPGDASYEEPYFYVSPWPAPAADELPLLHSRGRWHTQGWTGAVLIASQFAGDESQEALVRTFIGDAVAACGTATTV